MERSSTDSIVQLAADLASKADEIENVLIICTHHDGGAFSMDNDLTVAECLFLAETFKHWLLTCVASKE